MKTLSATIATVLISTIASGMEPTPSKQPSVKDRPQKVSVPFTKSSLMREHKDEEEKDRPCHKRAREASIPLEDDSPFFFGFDWPSDLPPFSVVTDDAPVSKSSLIREHKNGDEEEKDCPRHKKAREEAPSKSVEFSDEWSSKFRKICKNECDFSNMCLLLSRGIPPELIAISQPRLRTEMAKCFVGDASAHVNLGVPFIFLNVREIQLIAEVLKQNPNLQLLDLAGHELTNEAAKYLADAIVINTTLKKLNLSACFGAENTEGIIFILNALAKNSSIETVDLSSNFMGDECATPLKEIITSNSTIKTITINGQLIVFRTLFGIASVLGELPETSSMTLNASPQKVEGRKDLELTKNERLRLTKASKTRMKL